MNILYKNLTLFRDGNFIMLAIGCLLIYLAIAKDMEPSLLLPIITIVASAIIPQATMLINKAFSGK